MTLRHRIKAAILSIFLLTSAARAAESTSVLLQKAIYAEETEGNLEAAIKIYEGILKEGEANRSLMAQAQYRLGVCHLKKGNKNDAAATFRKVLGDFSKETDLVTKSRQRLLELGETTSTVVVREIWAKADSADGRISFDGRYFAFTDWDTGDLALRELASQQTRRLTDKGSWTRSAYYASDFVFSHKGDELAYLWSDGNERCEVRITSVGKPTSHTLLKYTGWFQPEDWSPDGNQLVALVWEPASQNPAITLVAVATGAVREIGRAGISTGPSTVRFSPNGKHLAYTRRPKKETPESEIYLVNLENGTETGLTDHPANDRLVGWAPDGKGLIFTSDRRGSTDLWLLQVSKDGKAANAPVILKANVGEIQPIGLSASGSFYYGVSGVSSALYETAIDLETGKLLSAPKEIPSRLSVTKSIGPKRLSPDGRLLAFSRAGDSTPTFRLEDLRTGNIREVPISMRGFSYPKWSADSRFVLVEGFSSGLRHGLFLVDGNTGEFSAVKLSEPGKYQNDVSYGSLGFHNGHVHFVITQPGTNSVKLVRHNIQTRAVHQDVVNTPEGTDLHKGSYAVSPDGKAFFYIRQQKTESGTTNSLALRRDLATGQEFEFFRSTNRVAFAFDPRSTGVGAISNMGFPIVLSIWNDDKFFPFAIKGIDLSDHSVTERFSVELPPRSMVWPHWFDNKPNLLFTKNPTPDQGERYVELWIILGDKNEIRKTELTVPGMRPVGTYGENQVVFEKIGPRFSAVWVMENFLPPVAFGQPIQ